MADNIKLLITDLDNTLFDWLSSFVPAFYAMVDVASMILSVDREQLLDEMKAVHQRYHNSEQPFALLETATVARKYPNESALTRKDLLREAFREFNEVRKAKLQLYPGVRETLQEIRKIGCVVVGHTEAVAENSMHRLELLKLLKEVQCLYALRSSAPSHPDPDRLAIEEKYKGSLYLLPSDHRKPDPAVLKDICFRHGVAVKDTLYVGDSIPRDVAMAKSAGARAAWARYGHRHDVDLWHRLVRVTHWSEADVVHEKQLQSAYQQVKPDIIMDSFADLLATCEFAGPAQGSEARALAASV